MIMDSDIASHNKVAGHNFGLPSDCSVKEFHQNYHLQCLATFIKDVMHPVSNITIIIHIFHC